MNKTICAIISICCVFSVVALSILFIKNFDAMPYNFRELFNVGNPFTTALYFSLVLYLIFGIPAGLALWLSRGSFLAACLTPFCIAIFAIVSFFLLSVAVPIESIHDILGSQTLSWLWKWEYIYRFVGLSSGLIASLSIAALMVLIVTVRKPYKMRLVFSWLVIAVIILTFSHWVVVIDSDTDNLVELMARGGDFLSSASLFSWLFILGVTASSISLNFFYFFRHPFLLSLLVLCSLLVGYLLLDNGTVSSLTKYGKTFSGLQFLLSSDRADYAAGPELLLRYCLAHCVFILTIVISQYPFWRFINLRSRSTKGLNSEV